MTWFDRAGNRIGVVGETAEYAHLALSPDEKRLAVSKRHDQSAEASLWVLDLTRASIERITHGRQSVSLVRWSPDSQRLMFSSSRNGPFNTLLQASAESGATPELLLDAGVGNWLNDWSRDGQFALYAADAQATSGDLWVSRSPATASRGRSRLHRTTKAAEPSPPMGDGSRTARTSPAGRRYYIRSFAAGSGQRQISTAAASTRCGERTAASCSSSRRIRC